MAMPVRLDEVAVKKIFQLYFRLAEPGQLFFIVSRLLEYRLFDGILGYQLS